MANSIQKLGEMLIKLCMQLLARIKVLEQTQWQGDAVTSDLLVQVAIKFDTINKQTSHRYDE